MVNRNSSRAMKAAQRRKRASEFAQTMLLGYHMSRAESARQTAFSLGMWLGSETSDDAATVTVDGARNLADEIAANILSSADTLNFPVSVEVQPVVGEDGVVRIGGGHHITVRKEGAE